jgi:hypothetical protein
MMLSRESWSLAEVLQKGVLRNIVFNLEANIVFNLEAEK